MTDARPIVLLGFMGSGKSSVGRGVAARLGWDFVDSDAEVERREGAKVAEIFRRSGEARFREIERIVVAELASRNRLVVALGGGAWCVAATRGRLARAARTVWLDATLEVCRERVADGGERPLWRDDDPVALRALYERRRSVYALACHRIDASGGSEEAVRAVVSLFEQDSH